MAGQNISLVVPTATADVLLANPVVRIMWYQTTMDSSKPLLGFIGLGVMGEPMCRNLLDKSATIAAGVCVYDVNPEAVARIAEHGADPLDGVGKLASSVEVLFLSLPGGAEVKSVLLGPDGILAHAKPGLIVVDLSTSPVGLSRELAVAAQQAGVRYADAPVARTRQAAVSGTLAIMVGADNALYELIQPYLACMASDISLCGDVGAGQMVKILNNMVLFQTVLGLAEALTLARRAGLDGEVLFDTLQKGSADSFALRNHGLKALLPANFPEQAFSTRYASKDLAYALQLAEDTNTETPGANTVREVFQQTIESGHGDNYWPALLNVIERS